MESVHGTNCAEVVVVMVVGSGGREGPIDS